jgi:hypothetical protein
MENLDLTSNILFSKMKRQTATYCRLKYHLSFLPAVRQAERILPTSRAQV